MMIDPTSEDPKDHLYFKNYRYFEKTDAGDWTIFALNLNDGRRSIMPRFKVGQKIEETLVSTREIVTSWGQGAPHLRSLKKTLNTIEGLLAETEPDAAYSALAATAIIENVYYRQIREELIRRGYWSQELESAHAAAGQVALSSP